MALLCAADGPTTRAGRMHIRAFHSQTMRACPNVSHTQDHLYSNRPPPNAAHAFF